MQTRPSDLREPAWLSDYREAQGAHFKEHGLPQPRLENWKYTALRMLEQHEFRSPDPVSVLQPEDLPDLAVPGARWRVVFVNGRFSSALSLLDDLPDGVRVDSLAELDEADLESLRQDIVQDFARPDEALAALCAADAVDGLVLRAEAGARAEQPIHVLHLSLGQDGPVLHNQRDIVHLAAGARVTIIEHHRSLGGSGNFSNRLATIRLAENSHLGQLRLQQMGDPDYLVTRQDCEQAAGSHLDYIGFDLGGRLVRHDLNCRLAEPEAKATLCGVYALDGKRHVDNHTRVDHVAPQTASEELFKGVLDGRARAVFNGKVVVHEGADGTDAAQTNKNLLLSPHAEVDTKPELVIYADDVKCAHGATVGQLDELQLFYLRTRGLPEPEARALLTFGFCREVVDRVDNFDLESYLTGQLVDHLPAGQAMRK
ncbi:MAG: Fe-S cluster assembly protein SufD [Xanthomonadales bacterium]|nr:Fe-S cluster assembly protein SufD [Xanthomonadales bacterium]